MSDFKIITDSTADLPEEYLKEHDIDCMNLCYMIGGERVLCHDAWRRDANHCTN